MLHSVPLLVSILIIVVVFISAMKTGVVKILAGGISAAIALVVMLAEINLLPDLLERQSGIQLSWIVTLAIGAVAAVIVFFVFRLIMGMILRAIFGPDSFLHNFSDGIVGGVLSVFSSLVVVFFLLLCVRIAGTVQELNYVASVSQPGIEQASNRFPAWPLTTEWRNQIESVPVVGDLFDLVEPFSRKQNRNLAALLLMRNSAYVTSYIKQKEAYGELIASEELEDLAKDERVANATRQKKQVELVLNPRVRDLAARGEVSSVLDKVDLKSTIAKLVGTLSHATSRITGV